eukprot:2533067-Rhodomonas_salina.1
MSRVQDALPPHPMSLHGPAQRHSTSIPHTALAPDIALRVVTGGATVAASHGPGPGPDSARAQHVPASALAFARPA